MKTVKHKILVLSGKGGVGKSTFSAHLAHGLAEDENTQVGLGENWEGELRAHDGLWGTDSLGQVELAPLESRPLQRERGDVYQAGSEMSISLILLPRTWRVGVYLSCVLIISCVNSDFFLFVHPFLPMSRPGSADHSPWPDPAQLSFYGL